MNVERKREKEEERKSVLTMVSTYACTKMESTPSCLSLSELQGNVYQFGPSENPNPRSSRTGNERLVVKKILKN